MGVSFFLQILIAGVVAGASYALVGLGYTVIYNAVGGVSFAQGQYVTIGAFVAIALLGRGISLGFAVVLAICVTTLISVVVERTTIRPVVARGAVAIGTVTLGQYIVLEAVQLNLWGYGTQSLPGFTGSSPLKPYHLLVLPQTFWVVGITFVVLVALFLFYRRTWLGKAMLACAENKEVAASLGINPSWIIMISFCLSGALGALAGVLITPILAVYYQAGLSWALKGMTAAIMGGLGNPVGAVIGGFVLGLVEAFASVFIPQGAQSTVAFILLLILLLFRPAGLFGVHTAARE